MSDMSVNPNRAGLDKIISRNIVIYRWAVLISFAFIAVGLAIAAFSDTDVDHSIESPAKLVSQIVDLEASGFLGLGIILMVITPIVMIVDAAIGFFRIGDRRYGFIATAVAAILLLSIVISYVIG